MAHFDLAIIGGGINGVGIARDAAGRGLKVLLVEQNDLASGTSSASSKLVHGGLRYLEHGAFRLVREALAEREVLLGIAPHIVRPMRFVLPSMAGTRSPLLVRLGLFLYDHLGRRRDLPPTRTLNLTHHPLAEPLKRQFHFGFEYSDCWVDDSRLVVLNAVDAAERGATIRTRTRCIRAERGELWWLSLIDRGRRDVATARVLINATGPWVAPVAETVIRRPLAGRVRLDKGSHIVVKRMVEHDRAYILLGKDKRVVFVLPFARDFTLIGTTDETYTGDPATVSPSAEEIRYLCKAVNAYFREGVSPADVVFAYSGVRALHDDGARHAKDVSRDYVLDLDKTYGEAPLLSVIGGKITTYRQLAETAVDKVAHFFTPGPAWTGGTPLPGGDFAHSALAMRMSDARGRWSAMPVPLIDRLFHAYGTRMDRVLGEARSFADLGQCFGADLTEAEVRYLMDHEWARTEDDVLWRRSKLGLAFTPAQRTALAAYMEARVPRRRPSLSAEPAPQSLRDRPALP